jgi:hypothetical protein
MGVLSLFCVEWFGHIFAWENQKGWTCVLVCENMRKKNVKNV